jgi:hypothetical protein
MRCDVMCVQATGADGSYLLSSSAASGSAGASASASASTSLAPHIPSHLSSSASAPALTRPTPPLPTSHTEELDEELAAALAAQQSAAAAQDLKELRAFHKALPQSVAGRYEKEKSVPLAVFDAKYVMG